MNERFSLAALTLAAALLLALLVVYFGGYWMLLIDNDLTIGYSPQGQFMVVQREASYRWGGDFARILFSPAHQLDRRVRPAHWELGPAGIDGMNIEAR